MAKRSCRRSETENRIHERAVKLRKMTDEQLIAYIEDLVSNAENESVEESADKTVTEFLNEIETTGISGIGKVTIHKLRMYAEGCGYIG
jgi:rhamnose utilization protein RhaD (predicted bifunctional aldolase and dehydrogenase)